MYVPVVPLGLMAVVVDAVARGRALPNGRFVLGAVGLLGAIGAGAPMVGLGPSEDSGTGPEVSVLHWNVIWGGGRSRSPSRWASIRREIVARAADLVVLSEAPPDDWLDQLVEELGPGASRVQIENGPADPYWFKLVVCSKGPLRMVRREPIADGSGMVVEAELNGRTVRLLVVDAKSHPLIPRTPRLRDVAAACRRASDSGARIDAVLGDFNTVGRSLGFDAIENEGEGYAFASRSSRGWRGTFPSFFPVYDIDHVLIRRDLAGLRSELFTNLASDHRGQVTRFRLPD
jgi:endonuclease/exonuclease/phosphatase family metal-dependent hydrolase